jgi:hypothetical protein
MVNVVHKFIIITAFAFSLNIMLIVLVVALSVGFERRFVLKPFITVFLLELGALLFHVVGGMILVMCSIGSGLLLVLGRLVRRRRDIPVFHAFALPGAAILACIAAFPYIRSIMAGGGTSPGSLVHIGVWNIATIILPLAILYRPAGRALRWIFSWRTESLAILATWIVTLAVGNVFIDLVTVNESKLVYFLFYLLFPPIVWQILDGIEAARGRRRMLLVAWTALLFVAPPVLTYRGFILDKPETRVEERRYYVTEDDRRIYAWIAQNTPPSSVVIESSTDILMPVYAHRRDFCPDHVTVTMFDYESDTVRRYESIRDKFLSGTGLAPEDAEVLMNLKIPLYVVLWQEDVDRIPRVREALDERPDRFRLVYENPGGRVYFIQGT